MKISDYIVEFLIQQQITDVFGYPGGMVTHLMESFRKYGDSIHAHVNYHEQGAAFAACGYAQITGKPGVAYATSGPGATNLLTGVCNAYFDSIPTIFITGQVNTFEAKGELGVRQRGFQETNIINMVRDVTKYCCYVNKPEDILYCLEKAFYMAQEGRPGPVLLDIPMNVQRAEIETKELRHFELPEQELAVRTEFGLHVRKLLEESKRPVLLLGNGVKQSGSGQYAAAFAERTRIPVVTSMPAFDILSRELDNNYGFIGTYGSRAGNFLLAKSDLVIAIGTRLDVRQVGARKEDFAPEARLLRVDVDRGELSNHIKEQEEQIVCGIADFLESVNQFVIDWHITDEWEQVCRTIRQELLGMDDRRPNRIVRAMSRNIPDDCVITTDVGQNQVWIAQSFEVQKKQRVLFSAGHGAMGYSLPAAIGAYYGSGRPVISMNGDGGLQMNIQELQFLVRERLPITVVVFNNQALGMIRHFQEMYLDRQFTQTVREGGYTTPDFKKIAAAYDLNYFCVIEECDLMEKMFDSGKPVLVEVKLDEPTYVFPKLEFGKPNQDQEPRMERGLYQRLMEL